MRKVPRILCERYELLDVLGKGAHGRIYLATDLVTHDRVAIKLVSFIFIHLTLYIYIFESIIDPILIYNYIVLLDGKIK